MTEEIFSLNLAKNRFEQFVYQGSETSHIHEQMSLEMSIHSK
jgi:hypothetical protein